MSIDMSEFHQVFFEESFEGLQVLESGLMALQPGDPDAETINQVFRAAHSIKGGSATFGFQDISEFTHLLETLLDEMRSGKRAVTDENAGVMLKSVDCLREMLEAAQSGAESDQARIETFRQLLDAELEQSPAGLEKTPDPAPMDGWDIEFKPHPDLFRDGNDPLRIVRELEALGELEVSVDSAALPEFDAMDCRSCYLWWRMRLVTAASRDQVMEAFAWVEDDCELSIIPLTAERDGDDSRRVSQNFVPLLVGSTQRVAVLSSQLRQRPLLIRSEPARIAIVNLVHPIQFVRPLGIR